MATRRALGAARALAMRAAYSTRPADRTTADAVSDIIYKTPTARKTGHHVHVLNCFMQDEPGILTRATGIMAARGYNIDSVVVSRTEIPGLSRMTITVNGEQAVVQQARKQLADLPQVWAVVDLSDAKVIEREILLIKLSTLGPGSIACGGADSCTPREPQPAAAGAASAAEPAEPPRAATVAQVVEGTQRLNYIRNLASIFGARVVDVGADCCIVELCAKSERVDAFMKLAAPFGILEAARSGRMAMSRTAKLSLGDEDGAGSEAAAADDAPPDLSHLPPS
ncbi:acetolactate synthase, regulatory subunit [Coemansia javaensis]|uniref:Acetolactate synthase, regulatory subunit n=1 Tax=Coemansia javaensis TaxID=2761396 RepID=A0A9W8LKN3_9FUNG|nr:acetolactate synthase, regulatory subunit [Coemansia javaensis]